LIGTSKRTLPKNGFHQQNTYETPIIARFPFGWVRSENGLGLVL